jgi:acetyl-CoA carboxylase biotin carboxyl carrier protein
MADKKSGIDQALIRDLANILKDTDLTEIEVEQDDLRIRVSRNSQPVFAQAPYPAYAPQMASAPLAAAAPAVAAVAAEPAKAAAPAGFTLASPMVGTCYHAPAPGSAPFVEVGSTVKEGQTVLIIEAMKTMNQIPAPRSGKIAAILVSDAAPVEFGEPLLIIE